MNSSCARGAITIPSGQRNVHLRFRAQIDQPLPIMLRRFPWSLTDFVRESRGRIRFGEDRVDPARALRKKPTRRVRAFSKNVICASSAGMDFLMVPLRLYRNNGAISAMGRNSFIGWSGKAGSSPLIEAARIFVLGIDDHGKEAISLRQARKSASASMNRPYPFP